MKSGPFGEHSSTLYGISDVREWKKVNSGLIKMFKAEVSLLGNHWTIFMWCGNSWVGYMPLCACAATMTTALPNVFCFVTSGFGEVSCCSALSFWQYLEHRASHSCRLDVTCHALVAVNDSSLFRHHFLLLLKVLFYNKRIQK